MSEPIPETVRERAELLVSSGLAGDRWIRERGAVGEAIPVHRTEGGLHSWFVPMTVGEKLAGFLQLLPDLTFLRYSSFQRRPGELERCPDAARWLDPDVIRATASGEASAGEELGVPVLTFEHSPERLCWAVPATSTGGGERTICVAGEAAWERVAGAGGLH